MSSKARAAMRAFLELDEAGRADFDRMREDYDYAMGRANHLPAGHPDKAARQAAGMRAFQAEYDL